MSKQETINLLLETIDLLYETSSRTKDKHYNTISREIGKDVAKHIAMARAKTGNPNLLKGKEETVRKKIVGPKAEEKTADFINRHTDGRVVYDPKFSKKDYTSRTRRDDYDKVYNSKDDKKNSTKEDDKKDNTKEAARNYVLKTRKDKIPLGINHQSDNKSTADNPAYTFLDGIPSAYYSSVNLSTDKVIDPRSTVKDAKQVLYHEISHHNDVRNGSTYVGEDGFHYRDNDNPPSAIKKHIDKQRLSINDPNNHLKPNEIKADMRAAIKSGISPSEFTSYINRSYDRDGASDRSKDNVYSYKEDAKKDYESGKITKSEYEKAVKGITRFKLHGISNTYIGSDIAGRTDVMKDFEDFIKKKRSNPNKK